MTARGAGWTVTGFGPGRAAGAPMGPRPAAARRRTEIEASVREAGAVGCHCLCAALHPARVGVCTGAAERNVPLRAEWNTPGGKVVEVSMCEACYGALAR